MIVETAIFFTVIEVNRHRPISVGILTMLSDTYNNIMSLSLAKTLTLMRMLAPQDYIA